MAQLCFEGNGTDEPKKHELKPEVKLLVGL